MSGVRRRQLGQCWDEKGAQKKKRKKRKGASNVLVGLLMYWLHRYGNFVKFSFCGKWALKILPTLNYKQNSMSHLPMEKGE